MNFGSGISAKPLTQFLLKNLGLSRSVADSAGETVIVCPEEESYVERAFHLEGQLDRVTAVEQDTSFDLKRMRIAGGLKTEGPTVAYRIDRCVFSRGRLHTNWMQDKQGGRQKRKLIFTVTDELETAVLPLSYFATIYFGHMVVDGGASALMAPDFGESYIDTQVCKGMAGHVARYWDLFGLNYTSVRDVHVNHA